MGAHSAFDVQEKRVVEKRVKNWEIYIDYKIDTTFDRKETVLREN